MQSILKTTLLLISLSLFLKANQLTATSQEKFNISTQHWAFPQKARGINTTSKAINKQFIKNISKWDVNILRINIKSNAKQISKQPLIDFKIALQKIDNILEICKEKKIGIIISLSGVPGRRLDYFWKKSGMIYNKEYLSLIWKQLAEKYKNSKVKR
jgi:aryl-phospho-beta-D-glucosidase BglC (GH1 family)